MKLLPLLTYWSSPVMWIFCSACLPGRLGLQECPHLCNFISWVHNYSTHPRHSKLFFLLRKICFFAARTLWVFFGQTKVCKQSPRNYLNVVHQDSQYQIKQILISWQTLSLFMYRNTGWAADSQEISTFTSTSSILNCALFSSYGRSTSARLANLPSPPPQKCPFGHFTVHNIWLYSS